MKRIQYWPVVAAAVVTIVLAAGCGGGSGKPTGAATAAGMPASPAASVSPPPATATLVKQVESAVRHATSVHISAEFTQDGKHVVTTASLNRAGDLDALVTVDNVSLTVLITQGRDYIKVTPAFLKLAHLPSGCAQICGKYARISARDARSVTGGLSWTALVAPPHQPGRLTYAGTATVNGQPAWKLRKPRGETAYVAARGAPYLLRVTKPIGRIDYTQWNHATIPPPPAASQVVSPGKLGG
jgi:hypothetical protein